MKAKIILNLEELKLIIGLNLLVTLFTTIILIGMQCGRLTP